MSTATTTRRRVRKSVNDCENTDAVNIPTVLDMAKAANFLMSLLVYCFVINSIACFFRLCNINFLLPAYTMFFRIMQ